MQPSLAQVKQAMIEELRRGPLLLPVEQRVVDDAAAALEQEAHDLLVSAGGFRVLGLDLALACQHEVIVNGGIC